MPTGIDPRYDDHVSELEPDKCQCCDEDVAVEVWMTTIGRKKICEFCLNYSNENDTGFLIEKICSLN